MLYRQQATETATMALFHFLFFFFFLLDLSFSPTGTARTGSRNTRTTTHDYHEPFGIRGGARRRSNEEGVFVFFSLAGLRSTFENDTPLRTPGSLDFGYTVGRFLYLPTSIKGSFFVSLATVFSNVAKF